MINHVFISFCCCQITFSLGCLLAMSACFWFYVQDIRGRNVVYATAIIMGCGGSVMLVTSLSLIAELIGQDKVMRHTQFINKQTNKHSASLNWFLLNKSFLLKWKSANTALSGPWISIRKILKQWEDKHNCFESTYKQVKMIKDLRINLLAFYREYRSLIGYATRYLFCDR